MCFVFAEVNVGERASVTSPRNHGRTRERYNTWLPWHHG